MKRNTRWFAAVIALAGSAVMVSLASANTSFATFDDFTSGAVYAGWAEPTAVIVSGTTNYVVTAKGYGSNYKSVGLTDCSGSTNVQLTVTLSGPSAANGKLGVAVNLIDADGTECVYSWYGQTLGHHVLNKPVSAPTSTANEGAIPGLDLATLNQLHLQLDPTSFGSSTAYTVSWEDLSLTGGPVTPTTNSPPEAVQAKPVLP